MSEKQGIIKAVVVLVVICLVISGALAVVNSFTAPVSAANAEARETAARQELIPQGFRRQRRGLCHHDLRQGLRRHDSGHGRHLSGGNDPSLQDAGRFQRNEDARRPDGKRELLWPV